MPSNKWGVRSIQVHRDQLHRLSNRFSQRMRRRLDTAGARENIKKRLTRFLVTIAILAVVGSVAGVKGLAYLRAERMLVSIKEMRHSVSLVAAARGGQLAGVPDDSLLAEALGRDFLKPEILTRVAGYRLENIVVAQSAANQFVITIRCEKDVACRNLVLSFRNDPAFILDKSEIKNPGVLSFRL